MKKQLALLCICAALLGCTGCGGNSSIAEEPLTNHTETTTADTTATAETTADTETTTESAQTDETETTATEKSESTAENNSDSGADGSATETTGKNDSSGNIFADHNTDGALIRALRERIQNWKSGPVTIAVSAEEDGIKVQWNTAVYGEKTRLTLNYGGVFQEVIISFGSSSYIIDDSDKTYCRSSDAYTTAEIVEEMLPLDNLTFTGTGKESYKGTACTYEEFAYGDYLVYRYYFNSKSELIGLREATVWDDEIDEVSLMDYKVTFSDTADTLLFAIPAGYSEISEEEMNEKLYEQLMNLFEQMD